MPVKKAKAKRAVKSKVSSPKATKDSPQIFILGIDVVIERDLNKHKSLLERAKHSLISFKTAVSHQVKKKKYYAGLLADPAQKYDKRAMKKSLKDINIDIRAMSDKVQITQEEIAHHTLIVDTLTEQLADYNKQLRELPADALSN